MRFAFMVLNDVLYNIASTLWSVHHLCLVNFFNINILNSLFLCECTNVFYGKTQYISISNSIGNYIFVQRLTKQHFGSSFTVLICSCIVGKNRSTCKTKHLTTFKEILDVFVGFSKLRTVTLVKNKNNALVF